MSAQKKSRSTYDFPCVEPEEAFRIIPPTEEQSLLKIKKLDPCDIVSEYKGGFRQFFNDQAKSGKVISVYRDHFPIPSLKTIGKTHPELREPIIEGIMRRGETMNIIASPKKGKSWLTGNLVMAFASGQKWFDKFQTKRGRALIFDNELHAETIYYRYSLLGERIGIPKNIWESMIHIVPLRGKGVDINGLEQWLSTIRPGDYTICILDSFYRFMPPGFNENDNASMTQLYNKIDEYAERFDLSFVLIHHASKGAQGNKSVTDVGSGAGAQSRACDVHLVLRDYDDSEDATAKDITIIDMAVRSFEPVQNFCVQFKFPVFSPAPASYDPKNLKGRDGQRGRPNREKEKANNILQEKLLDAIREPMDFRGMTRLAETVGLKISEASMKKLITEWTSQNRLIISEAPAGNRPGKWVNPNAGKNVPSSEDMNEVGNSDGGDGLDGTIPRDETLEWVEV